MDQAEKDGGQEGDAAECYGARGVDGVECCAEAGPAGAQVRTLAGEGAGIVRGVGCVVVYCYDWHIGGCLVGVALCGGLDTLQDIEAMEFSCR